MNRVFITGRLSRDPEAFTTQSGISRSTFTVAVNRPRKNENGTYDADFLTVVAWRQTAEYCNKYMKKGSKIAVEGSIQTRSYDAKDGTKRYVTEILADRVEGLDSRPVDGNAPARQQPQQTNDGFVEVPDDEGLPF